METGRKREVRMETPGNYDYDIPIIFALAEVIAGDMSDKVRIIRFDGIKRLQSILAFYQKLGYRSELLYGIAEKKCRMILSTSSKEKMDRVLKPRCPRYDGNKFIPDEYNVPEEELIAWSETSAVAPLNSAGHKRYMEVFKEVFPELSKELFVNE